MDPFTIINQNEIIVPDESQFETDDDFKFDNSIIYDILNNNSDIIEVFSSNRHIRWEATNWDLILIIAFANPNIETCILSLSNWSERPVTERIKITRESFNLQFNDEHKLDLIQYVKDLLDDSDEHCNEIVEIFDKYEKLIISKKIVLKMTCFEELYKLDGDFSKFWHLMLTTLTSELYNSQCREFSNSHASN